MDRETREATACDTAAGPLVTIVSPVYNQDRHVAHCIESALAQTYPHWEQIVVDDGSTDRTREIVASYGDPRIRLIALPHRGLDALAASYNAALAAASGSLVGILEGDDLWPPDKLARQVPLFTDPATVLSWGRATLIDEEGRVTGTLATIAGARTVVHLPTAEIFLRLTRRNVLAPTVTVMVRRAALDAVGGFRQSGSEPFIDLATWLRVMLAHDGRVAFVNAVLGHYRLHATQTSWQQHARMAREHWQVVRRVEGAADPARLARVGWTAAARHRAHVRDVLAEGELALGAGEEAEARRVFWQALRTASTVGDRLFAAAGLLSALARVDLLGAVLRWRDRARRPA